MFETVQAGCINIVLAQTVPSACDLVWDKIVCNIHVRSYIYQFSSYGHVHFYYYNQAWIKPLYLSLCNRYSQMSVKHFKRLY